MVDDACEAIILAGVPGLPNLTTEGGHPYPDIAVDLVKVLREFDVQVAFEHPREERKYVTHNAADLWLPILQVTGDFLVGLSSGCFVEIISRLLGRQKAEESYLHIDWRVSKPDGTIEQFRADGEGKEVLEALDAFERRLRD